MMLPTLRDAVRASSPAARYLDEMRMRDAVDAAVLLMDQADVYAPVDDLKSATPKAAARAGYLRGWADRIATSR